MYVIEYAVTVLSICLGLLGHTGFCLGTEVSRHSAADFGTDGRLVRTYVVLLCMPSLRTYLSYDEWPLWFNSCQIICTVIQVPTQVDIKVIEEGNNTRHPNVITKDYKPGMNQTAKESNEKQVISDSKDYSPGKIQTVRYGA